MESITKIFFIAIGGALGAVARHLVNISPLTRMFEHFPFPTFFINVTGSFFIGFLLIVLTDKFQVSDNVRMMAIVGFLGAFTTFSTFEIELFGLVKERLIGIAFLYMLLSVVAGFAGVAAGVILGQRIGD